MVEHAIALMRALATAISHRHEKAQALADEHIEPMYQALLGIHQDYVTGFSELASLLRDPDVDLPKVLRFLTERRKEFAPLRTEVVELAKAYGAAVERNWPLVFSPSDNPAALPAAAFCHYAIEYLYVSFGAPRNEYGGPLTGTRYTDFLFLVTHAETHGSRKEDLIRHADMVQEQLEQNWTSVTRARAVVRASCV